MKQARTAGTLFILIVLTASGCSNTRQIEALPPQPVSILTDATQQSDTRTGLEVILEVPEPMLPEDVHQLRFRITNFLLRNRSGEWTEHRTDANLVRFERGAGVDKTLLSTQIIPALYDSVALSLTDVYVEFDANAGGPLSLPSEAPLAVEARVAATSSESLRIVIGFDPEASLLREGLRWSFQPRFTAHVE